MRALTAALSLTLFGVAGCNLANFAMLWPPGDSDESKIEVMSLQASGVMHRRVVRVDGKGVEVWVAPSSRRAAKPLAYVLRFYGNGARADWSIASDAMLLPDFEIWGVNYFGYGGSEGSATLRGVARSALGVYDVLAQETQQHGRSAPILVMGTSMGTTAALFVAAERSNGVHGVVLQNPPPLKKLAVGHYGWWNLWLLAAAAAIQVPDEVDSEWNARHCRMPALFVTAAEDEIVPPEYQRRIVDAYAGKKEVIVVPNGTHNSALPAASERKIAEAIMRLASR
jgi:uncharacterized protein